MSKIVVALGGNALGNTAEEQLKLVTQTAKAIVDLVEQGHDVVVSHGNGPQVGMIQLGLSVAAEEGKIKAAMPLPECGAMSQGYIGYHLQNSIQNELNLRGINKAAVTVLTQVLVDPKDEAFSKPTKPVGAFYTKEQADKMVAEKGYTMVEDAGRGYRQVVASPKPVDIVEKEAIKTLVSAGEIVIAVGGGGIPVIQQDGKMVGTSAVIDKDFASAKLAELISADVLVILTAVDRICLDFNKSTAREIANMTVSEAEEYARQGQFAPGSMLPKVQAAINFAKLGGVAIIANLKNAGKIFSGESGTIISMQ